VVARGAGLVAPAYWAAEAYAALLSRTMLALAAAGAAVLVGRGGNEALAGRPGTLHVLVTAGERVRIQRVMAAEGLDAYDALDRVRASDRDRAAYVRQFFGGDWLDPRRYDLVVATDRLTAQAAAEVIAAAARAGAAAEAAGAGAVPATRSERAAAEAAG
jgi:cytidylate kinase